MCENNQIEEKDITFFSLKPERDFLLDELPLKEYTRRIIKHFLEKYDNDVLTVAAKLDIGKSTIYNMLKNNEI
jgi:transcriptional regulator with PAS, ATPase and Fis domain